MGNYQLWGSEADGPALEHHNGEAGHDNRLRLDMKILIHLIGLPSANQAKAIPVDPDTKEHHDAPGISGAKGDMIRKSVGRIWMKVESGSYAGGTKGGGCDVLERASRWARMALRWSRARRPECGA